VRPNTLRPLQETNPEGIAPARCITAML